MYLNFDTATQRLYSKLFVSAADIAHAGECAGYIQDNGWYHPPWKARGRTYFRQSAFTTSLIISYSRPFTGAHGWPKFPDDLKEFSPPEERLHAKLIKLRNQIYAHSDSAQFSIKPYSLGSFDTDVVTEPFRRLGQTDISKIIRMTDKLVANIRARLKVIRAQESSK